MDAIVAPAFRQLGNVARSGPAPPPAVPADVSEVRHAENDGHEEEQVYGEEDDRFIRQAAAVMPVKDLCRKGRFGDATFYK